MEENIKNRLILILAILTLIFFMGSVGSCANAHRQKLARDKEMLTRLDLEEKMSNFVNEKASFEEKIDTLSKELEKKETELQETKKALVQEQLINKSLSEDLEKVTKLKDALEENLKEALVKDKSTKSKR
jgi:uncharacterized protein YaaN involved in tellurite resistance